MALFSPHQEKKVIGGSWKKAGKDVRLLSTPDTLSTPTRGKIPTKHQKIAGYPALQITTLKW